MPSSDSAPRTDKNQAGHVRRLAWGLVEVWVDTLLVLILGLVAVGAVRVVQALLESCP